MPRKECCSQPKNLTETQERPDLTVQVCQVCGCRHFELTINPGKIGIQGKQI